jgi:hypothetical protein
MHFSQSAYGFKGQDIYEGSQIAQSVQRWATGWTIGGSSPGRGWEFFCVPPRPDRLWGLTQPPIQWVPGALSLGVKRPGREADHSPPSSAEVKNGRSWTSTPPIGLHGVVLS